jgi:transcriptional regulator with XRE-family HTH domain
VDNKRQEWPTGLSSRIGAAIRGTREIQNMSAVKLATRTAELGYPIHRVAISKLESGERDITVPELVVLAAALDTVPLALLLPGAAEETVEILPANKMTGAAAIGWFTGTTSATPAGVTHDRATTSRLDMTMRLNEVDEHLDMQRHNLLQAESGPRALTMPDALKAQMEESAQRARELIESLERQRESILHALAQDGHDGG